MPHRADRSRTLCCGHAESPRRSEVRHHLISRRVLPRPAARPVVPERGDRLPTPGSGRRRWGHAPSIPRPCRARRRAPAHRCDRPFRRCGGLGAAHPARRRVALADDRCAPGGAVPRTGPPLRTRPPRHRPRRPGFPRGPGACRRSGGVRGGRRRAPGRHHRPGRRARDDLRAPRRGRRARAGGRPGRPGGASRDRWAHEGRRVARRRAPAGRVPQPDAAVRRRAAGRAAADVLSGRRRSCCGHRCRRRRRATHPPPRCRCR